jgi:hypothetical protein
MSKKEFKKPKQEQGKFKVAPEETKKLANINYPVFCFRHIQKNYCISNCDNDQKAALLTKIHGLSCLTWYQIVSTPHEGFGCEKIPAHQIKATIPAEIAEDTTFLSFRFNAKDRFVGFRESNILHLLWVGEPYPH